MPSATTEHESLNETTRRRKTRARLIDAAYEVFAEQGVHAAAIETIVERAGFTRGAFYSNFETKEELFFALAERENTSRITRLEQAIEELPERDDVPELDENGIAQLIEGFLAMQSDDRRWCLVQNEFRLQAMRDPEVASRFLSYQKHFQRELANVLQAAIRAIGLEFTIDVVDLTRLVVDVYESSVQEAILSGEHDEDGAAHRLAMRVLPALVHNLTRPIA
ncbi:TetR/AcrR family transcriptional regulator [Okibacterium endophyticum]